MASTALEDEWIYLLSEEELPNELIRRSLDPTGDPEKQRKRLLLYSRYVRGEINSMHPERPSEPLAGAQLLQPPPDAQESPQSTNVPVTPDDHNPAQEQGEEIRDLHPAMPTRELPLITPGPPAPMQPAPLVPSPPIPQIESPRESAHTVPRDSLHQYRLEPSHEFSPWRDRFGDPNLQFALREEIRRRTQGENEPVADYLTYMLRRDEIERLEDLEHLTRRLEVNFRIASKYQAPPTPEQSLLPELSYRGPRNRLRSALATLAHLTFEDESNNDSPQSLNATQQPSPRPNQSPSANVGTRNRERGTNSRTPHPNDARTNRPSARTDLRELPEGNIPTVTSTSNNPFLPVNQAVASAPRPIRCHNCKQVGHRFNDCPGPLGHSIRASFDCGSSGTFLGSEAISLVESLGLSCQQSRSGPVKMAAGQKSPATLEVVLPVDLQGITREIKAHVLPSLSFLCIVGLDFIRAFDIVADFTASEWHTKTISFVNFAFASDYRIDSPTACNGILALTSAQATELNTVLDAEIPPSPTTVGVTSLAQHHIDVTNHPAIRQRAFRVSPKIQEAIDAEVDKMLADGIIEPSHSEWASPVVMVKKPDGSYRFCIDFRQVNTVSKKDAYPLPRMDGILDKIRSARYIFTVNLSQAYFQIPLAKESREVTAFIVPGKGLFHFTRMPYGLTGAPATFQRLVDRLIGPEMEPYAFAYLDDIIITTTTFEKHLEWLRHVLRAIDRAGLTINRDKCEFCCSRVKYLGFIVTGHGLQVDPDKVPPVVEYPVPCNVKQIRRFLGMASWYRRFIPDFATITEPLTRLLKETQL
ncbi:uncharacterized protein LOC125501083 [Athalia rosae]|uniref:uncharacterized protein LOC125501083 n=1 Tax=Athalia rosae TaxID=37344 RepID=UPI002033FB8D|nr:uncharacterized protein LOC125501083 [Athalia rosae]